MPEWLDRALLNTKNSPKWGNTNPPEHIEWKAWKTLAEVEEEIRAKHNKAMNPPHKK